MLNLAMQFRILMEHFIISICKLISKSVQKSIKILNVTKILIIQDGL